MNARQKLAKGALHDVRQVPTNGVARRYPPLDRLAQAYFGKSEKNRKALDYALQLASSHAAVFPMGSANQTELHKVKDPAPGRRLAEFFVPVLSDGFFFAPWTLFVDAECYNAVIEVYGLEGEKVAISPVGRGIIFALGAYDPAREDLGLSFDQAKILEDELDTPEALIEFLVCHDESASSDFEEATARPGCEVRELS